MAHHITSIKRGNPTMLNRSPRIFSIAFLILLPIITFSYWSCYAASPTEKNILILNAYTPDYPAVEAYNKGMKSEFQQYSQYAFSYSYEYLDVNRFSDDENYLEEVARHLRVKYSKQQPDLIITQDTLASFLMKYCQDH